MQKSGFMLPRRLQGLQPTLIRQFFERALPDSINFGLGEPDLPTPEFMRKEAARIALEEKNGYTPHAGIPALREKIAEQYPSFLPYVMVQRATMAEQQGRLPDALRWLGEARRLDPRNLDYCEHFARIARKSGDYPSAVEALRWAIIQHPTIPTPRAALVETYFEAGEPADAEDALQDLIRLGGDTPETGRLRKLLDTPRAPPGA